MLSAVTDEDLSDIIHVLVNLAKGGDLRAIREVLDRTAGKAERIGLGLGREDCERERALQSARERRISEGMKQLPANDYRRLSWEHVHPFGADDDVK